MSDPASCPVTKLDTLLLATDGSEFSKGAVREGIRLAKICSSRLIIMSVVETNPEYQALAPDLVSKVEESTRKLLDSVKKMAEKEGVRCETRLAQGQIPYQRIVEEAEKADADLIIMGRRGRKGIKKLMMGSVTALVIGHSHCNILIVPRAAELHFRRILIATDGSDYSNRAAVEAINIAKRCKCDLIALSVASDEKGLKDAEDNVQHVRKLADKEGVGGETISIIGIPYAAVVTTAQVKEADLIVVGCRGKTALQSILMGGVAERVIALAPCAVLAVKENLPVKT